MPRILLQIHNSGSFNSKENIENLKRNIELDLSKYTYLIDQLGCNAEFKYGIGTDVAEEVEKRVPEILIKSPNSTFIGGQLIFEGMYRISKILHNFTIFSIQRRLYKQRLTTIIIPISLTKALDVNNLNKFVI